MAAREVLGVTWQHVAEAPSVETDALGSASAGLPLLLQRGAWEDSVGFRLPHFPLTGFGSTRYLIVIHYGMDCLDQAAQTPRKPDAK